MCTIDVIIPTFLVNSERKKKKSFFLATSSSSSISNYGGIKYVEL